ncbi:MAG: type II CAAX endopeptidase family protein [bacterium]
MEEIKKHKSEIKWNSVLGVFSAIFIFFAAQLLAAIWMYVFALIRFGDDKQASAWISDSTLGQFFSLSLSSFIVIGLVLWFLWWKNSKPSVIGLVKPKISHFFYGIATAPVYFVFLLIVLAIAGAIFPSLNLDQKQEIGFDNVSGSLELFLIFVGLAIIVPIAEEILFRGLLYTSFKKAMPIFLAALATSLIFAAGHLPEGGDAGPLYVAGIDTFLLSFFLIFLREKTGSLWSSIALHATKNSIAFLFVFVLKIQ